MNATATAGPLIDLYRGPCKIFHTNTCLSESQENPHTNTKPMQTICKNYMHRPLEEDASGISTTTSHEDLSKHAGDFARNFSRNFCWHLAGSWARSSCQNHGWITNSCHSLLQGLLCRKGCDKILKPKNPTTTTRTFRKIQQHL
jgi:hypothetical protein